MTYGNGSANRSSPTGGWANGTPRYASIYLFTPKKSGSLYKVVMPVRTVCPGPGRVTVGEPVTIPVAACVRCWHTHITKVKIRISNLDIFALCLIQHKKTLLVKQLPTRSFNYLNLVEIFIIIKIKSITTSAKVNIKWNKLSTIIPIWIFITSTEFISGMLMSLLSEIKKIILFLRPLIPGFGRAHLVNSSPIISCNLKQILKLLL